MSEKETELLAGEELEAGKDLEGNVQALKDFFFIYIQLYVNLRRFDTET